MGGQRVETQAGPAFAATTAAVFGLACVLGGCNFQRQPAPPQAPPQLTSSSGFFFNDDGDTAGLAYGVANSDDIDLMLECGRGARRVNITDAAHPGARQGQALTLISGDTRSDLPTRVALDEERGQPLASGGAPTDSPVLTAFRRSGRITVKLGAQQRAYAATPAEQIAIARFFTVCERQ